jgi:hypothetical protein
LTDARILSSCFDVSAVACYNHKAIEISISTQMESNLENAGHQQRSIWRKEAMRMSFFRKFTRRNLGQEPKREPKSPSSSSSPHKLEPYPSATANNSSVNESMIGERFEIVDMQVGGMGIVFFCLDHQMDLPADVSAGLVVTDQTIAQVLAGWVCQCGNCWWVMTADIYSNWRCMPRVYLLHQLLT